MHVFVTPSLVAVTVTVSPDSPPVIAMVGVVLFVLLSVVSRPESDAVARSGNNGVAGAIASIVIESGELAEEVLPAGSVKVAEIAQTPSVNEGKSQVVAAPTT